MRARLLQRKCACGGSAGFSGQCEDCGKKRIGVQRRAAGPADGIAPPIVHDVLRSPGEPLDAATRAFMQPRFGHDFSRVRVHTDARASESARAVSASAYTVGQHVVFAENHYDAATGAGIRLLAHELTHTVQQPQAAPSQTEALAIGGTADPFERDADRVADAIALGQTARADSKAASGLQRQHDGDDKKKKFPPPEDFKREFLALDLKDPHPINLHLPGEKGESARDKVARALDPILSALASPLPNKFEAKAKAGIVDAIMSGVPKGAEAAAKAAGVTDPHALEFISKMAEGFMNAPVFKSP
jgi:hypothetical protein